MSHESAVQKAREIAARLSGKPLDNDSSGGKRKRWGVMPEDAEAKKPKLDQKHIWVSGINKDRPGRHFVLRLQDDLADMETELKMKDPYLAFTFKGKGSSTEPPLPGVPEEPLHIDIEGSNSELLRQAQHRIQQLLEKAELAPVDESALVATPQLTMAQLKDYKPKSVASMIGTDRLAAALLHGEEAAVNKEIKVPNGVVGFLIGRGGETIASLQAQSACKMQIQKEFDLQPGQTERIITLSAATQEAIDDCEGRIMNMVDQRMREEQHRNMPSGHAAMIEVKVPDSEVGLIIGKQGATVRSIQEQTGANIQVPKQGDPNDPSTRTLQISHATEEGARQAQERILSILRQRPGADTVTIHVPIPNDDVGLCIGRQGCVIQAMQQSTGTRIQIPGSAMPGEIHRIATVTGKPEATDQVKAMIQRIIQEQSSGSIMTGQGSNNYGGGGGGGNWGSAYNAGSYATNDNYGAHDSYAQQAPAPAATTSTDHYEPFFRYAYYYGEETARAYYGAWSPPVGTPNPYGVNPNLAASAPPAAPPAPAAAVPAQQQQPPQQQQQQQQEAPRETSRRHVSNLPAWMNK